MTVAEKIAQRRIELACILNDSNNAISSKGGTPADDLSGLQDAIVSIPTGSELPELTTPAEVGHVLSGKEYIDGNGDKKSGTLVVCDTVYEVETLTYPGTGLTVELESSADGSNKTLTIPEPNLLPENIKNGVSIFGIAGSAKTLRVETGTITPAADANNITIPHALSDIAAINVFADYDNVIAAGSGTIYGLRGYIRNDENFAAPNVIYYQYNGSAIAIGATRPTDNGTGKTKISVSTSLRFRAGITYHYVLYDWEET